AEPVTVTAGTAPLLVLRDLIADPRFPALFARALRAADADFRGRFPRDPAPVLAEIVRAMTFVLETTEAAAGDTARTDEVVEFARHLGADHRKLELGPHHHQHFGDALAATLRHLAGSGWTESLETTLATAYRVVSTALQQGAASGHGPARVGATVVDVLRPPLVRRAGIGDRWVLADPVGALEVDRSTPHRDVLMVAGGTGIAPLRCLLTDMQRHRDNPRVHLFYGARHPGDLYDLPALV